MEKNRIYTIEPVNAPPGSPDYLPCSEADATGWAVVLPTGTRFLCKSREEAETVREEYERRDRRAYKFIWLDDDLEHG